MFDADQYQLERLTSYPQEQWRLALARFPAPSNRPPHRYWRERREGAIAWLCRYGVPAEERLGKVYIGEFFVDGSYVE